MAQKFKDLEPSTLSLLETLLSIDPDMRGTATDALNSEVNTTVTLKALLRACGNQSQLETLLKTQPEATDKYRVATMQEDNL